MKQNNIVEFDKEHIWHPYTSMINPLPVYPVKRAYGVYIELETGEKLIDGMSSWWSVIHGYNNPILNKAAKEQIDKVSHVMFGGLTHKPAVELASKLIELSPGDLNRVFYCDSGSVAVEVAVKMSIQYMQSIGKSKRTKIATVLGGYHGDTWHAMSVCDPVTGMHSLFNGRLPIQYFAPRPQTKFEEPWSDTDIEPVEKLLRDHHEEIAAFIIEPVVQGAGGMWFYNPEYLRSLRKICDKYEILLIADEIATGFGRTGKMFACNWADVVPDIMCIGKAITGGYLSFAAVMATDKVALTISENAPHVFMHGPTFMGNPLACAVAVASIGLLDEELIGRVKEIELLLKKFLKPAKNLDQVKEIRVLGAIGVLELRKDVDMSRVQKRCVEEGVWIRPFGKLFYIMPPFIISDDELEKLCIATLKIVSEE